MLFICRFGATSNNAKNNALKINLLRYLLEFARKNMLKIVFFFFSTFTVVLRFLFVFKDRFALD